MVHVRMLKPYLIPLFGWLPQGVDVVLPDDVAAAMIVNRYAEYVASEQPVTRWSHSKTARAKDEPPAEPGAGGNEK